MRKYAFCCVVFVILALQMGPLTDAQGDVVGRLTQVEGRVDILRGGQLPATPAKIDDGVQPGDVLRTKSLSKAQITFIDNSTMTIDPESRVAIEAYMFDPAQNKRNAVIELFKGLAHVVVNKVYQSAEPDFVVKTQTAIMGIRGTEFGIRLQPNSSDILNFKGRLQVGNIFPEVGQLPQRAFKVAYSFGSGSGGGRWVILEEMQGTSVGRGLPPTQGYTISDEDRRHFMNQLGTGLNICRRNPDAEDTETGGGPPSETISGCAPTSGLGGSDIGNIELVSAFFGTYFTPPYTPPNIPPEKQTTLLTTESPSLRKLRKLRKSRPVTISRTTTSSGTTTTSTFAAKTMTSTSTGTLLTPGTVTAALTSTSPRTFANPKAMTAISRVGVPDRISLTSSDTPPSPIPGSSSPNIVRETAPGRLAVTGGPPDRAISCGGQLEG